jgi:putative toxin-antitoxin system antitoxin component (TIGR02293 family)
MTRQRARARAVLRGSAAEAGVRAVEPRSSPAAVAVTTTPGTARFQRFIARERPTAEKIRAIRSGVEARVVDDMVQYLGVPKSVLFTLLHTPESTAHRLIKDNRRLDAAASERVVRVADVIRVAEDTLGGREAATRWLKTPNLALGDATPLSLLDTEPGANEVRRVLSSIKYGGVV